MDAAGSSASQLGVDLQTFLICVNAKESNGRQNWELCTEKKKEEEKVLIENWKKVREFTRVVETLKVTRIFDQIFVFKHGLDLVTIFFFTSPSEVKERY